MPINNNLFGYGQITLPTHEEIMEAVLIEPTEYTDHRLEALVAQPHPLRDDSAQALTWQTMKQ